MDFLYFILIGAVAGWLAGQIMKGSGFGVIGNIVLGIVGAVLGGWLLQALEISLGNGLIGSLVTAVIGAVVIIFIGRLLKK